MKQNMLVKLGILVVSGSLFFAFLQTFVRVQTTLLGYKIGEMKQKELKLKEDGAKLHFELAKITSKDHLKFFSESGKIKLTKENKGSFVSQN